VGFRFLDSDDRHREVFLPLNRLATTPLAHREVQGCCKDGIGAAWRRHDNVAIADYGDTRASAFCLNYNVLCLNHGFRLVFKAVV